MRAILSTHVLTWPIISRSFTFVFIQTWRARFSNKSTLRYITAFLTTRYRRSFCFGTIGDLAISDMTRPGWCTGWQTAWDVAAEMICRWFLQISLEVISRYLVVTWECPLDTSECLHLCYEICRVALSSWLKHCRKCHFRRRSLFLRCENYSVVKISREILSWIIYFWR